MKSTIISAISGIALAAALAGPGLTQEGDTGSGEGINSDALSSEQVQLVQEHCAKLLSEEGAVTGDTAATGDGASAGDPDTSDSAQPEPSAAAGDLASDPLTESELAEREDTGASDGAANQGETSADAVIADNAAAPADEAGSAEALEFDLSKISAQDCIDAGIPG